MLQYGVTIYNSDILSDDKNISASDIPLQYQLLRNANLERYLGMADLTVDGKGLTNIFTPESSPKEPKVVKVTATVLHNSFTLIMFSCVAQEVKRANEDNFPSKENDATVQ